MRHAKSSWADQNQSDFERPLNARGRADATRMGGLIRREDLIPDQIITSSAVRALKTARLFAEESGYEGELSVTRHLYHAPPESYYEVLNRLDDAVERAMVVGHNPGIETFLSKIILTWTSMTTANIAHVQLEVNKWHQFDEGMSGRLVDFWQPKTLIR